MTHSDHREAPVAADEAGGQLVVPQTPASGRLIFDPLIRPDGAGHYQICGRRDDRAAIAWGFWGGLLAAGVVGFLILSARDIYQVWDVLWAFVAIGIGLLAYRYGKRTSLRQEVLCEVDLGRQTLSWPTQPSPDNGDQSHVGQWVVDFDEISELVFGMTNFPVSRQQTDVQVDAFTLLVRDRADRLIPVIEATPNKEEAHTIANILGNEFGLPITYVGRGIQP